jgi:amino acid adenylation domain-containing protein
VSSIEDSASSIDRLFAAQAAARPGATAVELGERSLTYAELEARANRLANFLTGRGIGPEALVGVLLPRSLDQVVAILGVLKAGAAYVPLDPAYPAERLSYIWQDARAGRTRGAGALLLGSAELSGCFPPGAELVDPARVDEEIAALSPAAPASSALPDNLAYVIYTSGSTGRPKGVAVPHRGLLNTIRAAVERFGTGPGSRVLQLASISFDASVLETWMALAAGGTLVLTPRETLLSGEALGGELARREITAMAIPPSLLERVERSDFPRLRTIVVGAEACSAATARRWSAGRTLWNAYAPTEATIFATLFACGAEQDEAPPLGRAIAGMRVHLLRPSLPAGSEGSPAAPGETGEAGEILLGGAGVVRGYLGRPDLTAERFVPDPFSARGERLYRTGDLGQMLPAGDLEFLGRVDHQVKVRGLRVELGEIEAVLASHPAVRSAVVAAREDPPADGAVVGAGAAGPKRLVAYLVARSGAASGELAPSELRSFLARQLPDYMIPAAFVRLDALPMTPTGKVDRNALPAPGRERPGGEAGYVAPAGPLEEALARIWGEVLGLDLVGARDNLFELGGHSLIASQIVSRVRAELGLELPLLEVFTSPTVAGLAERLAAPAELPAIEVPPGAVPARGGRTLPPIVRVDRDGPLPLSFAQERVWFLNQLAPGAIAYNFQFTVRFSGPLAPDALRRALLEVVRRHEILRTSFPAEAGRPRQRIHPGWPEGGATLPLIDLTALAGAQPGENSGRSEGEGARDRGQAGIESVAESWIRKEIRRGFDITRVPLVRWLLLRLAPRDHLLLHVEHHFVHDGWSLAVFLREVKEIYDAFVRGRPSPLPELPVQYADFAVWQRRWLEAGELDEQLAYWRARLAGVPQLELPTDHPRPPALSFRGGALRVDMPHALYEAVRAFGRRTGFTLFMSMLAAFYALLYRYTGQADVAIGSGLANRRLRESENLIGMVVNTVVLRTGFDPAQGFRALLAAVRATTLEAHVYQDLPFEKLVEALQPDRELSRNPLFQVLFSFHDAPVPDLELAGGVSGYLFERHNGSAKSDLNVVAKPRAEQRAALGPAAAGDELTMVWEYSSDLYDAPTIARLWGHFQVLLAGALADDAANLADLPLLTAEEIAQLAAWNRTAPGAEAPADPLLRFAAHAARRPLAPAVSWDGGELSYGELDRRSRRLAAELRARGVGPEVVVAICAERSPETVIAALAILQAGGAYLPLDPGYPRERLDFMLGDSGAAVVIARPDLVAALPDAAPPVVRLDAAAPAPDLAPNSEPAAPPGDPAGRLAYVIYTSGSTGRPKGVEIHRAGLASLVDWHLAAYGVREDDRATMLAGPAFDAAVWELWPYLAAGASLHIPPPAVRASPEQLLGWLAEREITICFLPTPLAAALLAEIERRPPARLALRALLTGGDRLQRAPEKELPFAVWNHYGPTESTVVATAAPVPAGLEGAPPIGRPIAGTRTHLLDRAGGQVPVGVPGELAIGGAGLARGYRGRPDLTAERFVPDPWGSSGERLYRTGDLARLTAQGDLEFLGRRDRQVKIRGFRIELGEIEAVLREQAAVREAVVTARPSAGGEARLVAYVVTDATEGTAGAARAEELRSLLRARLPEFMVPAAFVRLPELPLTRNGKIDLAALPDPEPEPATGGGGERGARPSSAVEELLHGIWSALLGRGDFGVDANFFQLGGHSLLATQLLSRVRDAVQVEVPLATLFTAPTVAGLARAVEPLLRAPGLPADLAPSAAGGIQPRAAAGPAPLSFAQERLWFLDQLAPGGSAYNIGRAYALSGALSRPALAHALGEIVRRHEALRTGFTALDDRPVQVVEPAVRWRLPLCDLAALPAAAREAEAERLAGATVRRAFDLASGRLLRTVLVRRGADEHLFVVAMHHIVSDGWSLSLFTRELAELYGAFAGAGGTGPDLPALPVQYADYAVWQRQRLRRGALADQLLAYWRQQLAGAPPALELPTDRARRPVQSFRGGVRQLVLPAALAAELREFAWRNGATPFMVLLAVLTALLSRHSGQSDVAVGSPIAGRNRSEIERLIGFFVNTLVLRSRWHGEPTLGELVALARQATLGGHAHQELPFENLVAELSPDRNLGQTPLFQVLFTLQHPAPEPRLPGLRLAPVEVVRPESRFDLEIEVADGAAPVCRFRYDSDLFDGATVARMTGHFANLLAALVANPECRLAAAPLLSAAERHQLLLGWNDTATTQAPAAATLAELFATQARRTPQAVALVSAGGNLTYAELDGRAERLARHLRAAGAGPEVPVGVLLERTPRLVEGLLAILKAGGAYLPLDPAYPPARIAFMLEDARAPLLLTEERLLERLPGGLPPCGVRILDLAAYVSQDGDAWPSQVAALPPLPGSGSGNLAYVIYTSGSTGRPKGVAIEQRSAVALVAWAHRTFSPADLAGVFAATSICFDLSVFELFVPLTCGGAVILGDDALALASPPRSAAVTLINTVPSAMAELLRLEAVPPSVRAINLAGEPLSSVMVAEIHAHTEARRVLDLYGPSEDTTYSTCALRRAGEPATIGRPLDDTSIYLLDPRLEPVPSGVQGELCIAGAGLARGYLHHPGLTAEKFVPDPFAALASGATPGGRRMYRTGDLARTLPDGRLQFLGRGDHQVKVRGFRIELGEIEAQLARHPALREVAVVAREEGSGEGSRLVAYVVPAALTAAPAVVAEAAEGAAGTETSGGLPEELRAYLGRLLPAYMVPAAWVVLRGGLPRTPNGKVDRSALPVPSGSLAAGVAQDATGTGYEAPRTAEERALAVIWAEVLGLDRVSAHDDFFRLGGHSLLATRVVARLRRELGVDLPLRSLFQTPTLSGLAGTVLALQEKRQRGEHRETSAGRLRPAAATAAEGELDEEPAAEAPARPLLVPLARAASRQRRSALNRPGEP